MERALRRSRPQRIAVAGVFTNERPTREFLGCGDRVRLSSGIGIGIGIGIGCVF
ncbi:hypothetical protein Poly51_55900 [Rubripirellula tenax]|uniref:Uncharacterized protein n=1 Tax=Rubripirellula tenax TaxID=2528015 RepID=A0A5C6ECI6_9BACT|nr:hypothetical protein Poly51_55900 [Rubripirellula tenax]